MSTPNEVPTQTSQQPSTPAPVAPKKRNIALIVIITVVILFFAIAVVAVGAGAFFINSYQNQIQSEQAATPEKKLPDTFTQNSKPYSNTKEKFEMKFPKDWEVKENYFGAIVSSLSKTQSIADTFRENVNVVSEALPNESISLSVYTEASLKNVEKAITEFKLISKEETTTGNRKAMVITYTGKQGVYNLKYRQTLIVNKKMAYVITYVGTLTDFDAFLPDAQNIADSFKVTD